jgi:hypothetical protein
MNKELAQSEPQEAGVEEKGLGIQLCVHADEQISLQKDLAYNGWIIHR